MKSAGQLFADQLEQVPEAQPHDTPLSTAAFTAKLANIYREITGRGGAGRGSGKNRGRGQPHLSPERNPVVHGGVWKHVVGSESVPTPMKASL